MTGVRHDSDIVVRLPSSDRMAVRVVVSPYYTLSASIFEVLKGLPRGCPASWQRYIGERAEGVDTGPFDVYGPTVPDFIANPPDVATTVEQEIRRLRETTPETVREQLAFEFGDDVPAAYQPFVVEPRAALERLADALTAYWDAALRPLWPSMEALLEREVLRLGEVLATDGPSALLARVHHRIALREGELHWLLMPGGTDSPRDSAVLGDRRLVLVPMCCGPDALWTSRSRDDEVLLGYSVPGVGLLWGEVGTDADPGLDRVLGRTRARVMRAVHTPATTSDVAAQLDTSPALVAHHLKALRETGMVDGTRFGRRVYYRVTAKGRNVWNALES